MKTKTKSRKPNLSQRFAESLEREKVLRQRIHDFIDHLMQNEFFREQITDYLANDAEFIDDIRSDLEETVRDSVRQEIIDSLD